MSTKVRFFDYPLQFRVHENEYMDVIKDTLSRGAYILGDDLKHFEKNLAAFVGSRFAIGVGNGTDAILLALIAAGVGPEDEVISVSHTFVATIEVIKFLGAKPVLVDIADDHNINVDLVEAAITPKTKAIIPVQLNGRICTNIQKLTSIAEKYNIVVIEDAAQSLGAKYRGKGAGTFGLAGCFSFYPAKLLGTFGDAGAVVTDNEEVAMKITMLRNHGRGSGTDINLWGLNCRMDNLHAAILDFKLKLFPDWISRRREIAQLYYSGLSALKSLKLPHPPEGNSDYYDVYQNYEIEAERRDELVAYLNEKGIEVMRPWGGKGVHQFSALGLEHTKLPRTEEFFNKAVMLPLYPELDNDQISYIVQSVQDFYGSTTS